MVKLCNLGFLLEKIKTVEFLETIATCDLEVGRCRQLIELMKVSEYCRSRSFLYLGTMTFTYES